MLTKAMVMENDVLGMELVQEQLPQRVRTSSGNKRQPRQAAAAGEFDVEQGDVRPDPERLGQDLGAVGHLGDHGQVVLQVEQDGQGAAHHRLVLGQQDADRRFSRHRAPTRSG